MSFPQSGPKQAEATSPRASAAAWGMTTSRRRGGESWRHHHAIPDRTPVLSALDSLGITPRLIESHYENNYGGAFTRLNAISEEAEVARSSRRRRRIVIRRLKQDEAAALNSLALHELYFASLGGDGRAVGGAHGECTRARFRLDRSLARRIRGAGEFARWRLRLGSAELVAARGHGSSITASPTARQPSPAAITVLALDMYEHAYHLDFGPNAISYVGDVHA